MKSYWLPYWYKYIGAVLLLLAFITGYLYFLGGKPDFFTIPTFAFVTAYFETRYVSLIQTNLLDEITLIFLIIGLAMIGFSKEKREIAAFDAIRLKALVYAVYASIVIWIIMIMLVYGWTIFLFSSSIFFLFLLIYLIICRIMIFKYRKASKTQ